MIFLPKFDPDLIIKLMARATVLMGVPASLAESGAVGFPLLGVSVRVTDPDTGKELAREEIGMIEVKGPNVFKGYWRMPEKTKAEFRPDGFFITGDLGKIDAKGYVHILGRGKDLVISGGFNVYPKEIESEIDAMPGVVESAVIGRAACRFRRGRHRRGGLSAKPQCSRASADGSPSSSAKARLHRRRAAAQHHGQGAEERFARHLQKISTSSES